MDIFDVLTLIGGLCLFLFGMNVMGDALERRAGGSLKKILATLTKNKFTGFLTGLVVTMIIQSSSATTVMVVGFVNSGIITLKQSIGVIMGANLGTTITAWILSLGGISSGNIFMQFLKPKSFTPILAVIGIAYLMFSKSSKKKDTGMILLGFATLMYGMDSMSGAVSGLAGVPAFQNMFLMFKNPILGVLVGAVLTAVIQSSSASVGILQALTVTGQVSYGAAVPIIMGQNIGTCITALLSSFGTNKNAKRAAVVHLLYNIIGTVVWLSVFSLASALLEPAILDESASYIGVAFVHTLFKTACLILFLPAPSLLEKMAIKLVPDAKTPEEVTELDERLLTTPAVALERCYVLASEMGTCAISALKNGIKCLESYSPELAESVREGEKQTDHYEDILGSYLVKFSALQNSQEDCTEAAKMLKIIGDFERISDHAVNLVESAQELQDKNLTLSKEAYKELSVLSAAVTEILDLAYEAFTNNNLEAALNVEPLEQLIDRLKEKLRTHHIRRLQQGDCGIEGGFVWSDMLTNLERTADHCSNIAVCIIDSADMNMHQSLEELKQETPFFKEKYAEYKSKYSLA